MPRIYGARYGQTAALDLPAVARLIRADLKTAADDTGSPLFGLTFQVRCRNGTTIDVAVDGLPDSEIFYLDEQERPRPTVRASKVRLAAGEITDAYNFNGLGADVRFWSGITVVTDDERTYRASMKALKTSRTAA